MCWIYFESRSAAKNSRSKKTIRQYSNQKKNVSLLDFPMVLKCSSKGCNSSNIDVNSYKVCHSDSKKLTHTHTHTHKYIHLQNICTKSDFKLITIHMFIKIWMFPINKFRCKQRKRWNQIEINTCIYLQFTWRELHYASLKHLLTLIACFLRVSANLISSCPFQVKTKSFGKRMPFFKTVHVG